MKCKNCNRELINAYDTKKFCNNKCQQEFRQKEAISHWLNDPTSVKLLTNTLKRYIKDLVENKCSKCGWNEVNEFTGNIPIEIDHIDGDSENNNPSNLKVLCPSCHSLTSTFRGANRKSRRAYRQKYYKESVELRKIKKESKIIDKKNLILNTNINFSKRGWCAEAANILGITSQKVRGWMKQHLPEIEENAYKRK